MSTGINIIYDKMTKRVLLYEEGGCWVMPSYLNLAHYDNGFEPMLIGDSNGGLYLKPNTVIVKDLFDDA